MYASQVCEARNIGGSGGVSQRSARDGEAGPPVSGGKVQAGKNVTFASLLKETAYLFVLPS